MIMEFDIGVDVLSRYGLRPELLHKEHLVSELWIGSVTCRTSLFDPVRQVSHEVKEEITVGHTDN